MPHNGERSGGSKNSLPVTTGDRLAVETTPVTHTACGTPVELKVFYGEDRVYCPACRMVLDSGDLSDPGQYWAVLKDE